MCVISCDPSSKYCAFAVFSDRRLIKYAKVKTNVGDIKSFFDCYSGKGFAFFIEDQYLNLNVKTLIKLVTVRTMVLTLAQISGAEECSVIAPQRWQTVMLGVNIKTKRQQRKRLSCIVASQIAKEDITDPDIADAICIGDFARRIKNLTNSNR